MEVTSAQVASSTLAEGSGGQHNEDMLPCHAVHLRVWGSQEQYGLSPECENLESRPAHGQKPATTDFTPPPPCLRSRLMPSALPKVHLLGSELFHLFSGRNLPKESV